MMAVNPQIIKSYSRGEKEDMIKLINNSALFSFLLLLLFMFPVFFKLNSILVIWLDEFPDHTHDFTILVLIMIMIRALANPVVRGIHATGDIKSLNIYAGIFGLLPLPAAWICFKIGLDAISAFWILLVWALFANAIEIIILKSKLRFDFSIKQHLLYVYLRCVLSVVCVCAPVYLLSISFGDSFINFCFYYGLSLIVEAFILFFVGAPKEVRLKIVQFIKSKYETFRAK